VTEAADLTMFEPLSDLTWANLALGGVSLPALPPESLQKSWCGSAGARLAVQSAEFYRLVKDQYARYGTKPFRNSTMLDFGCGWGRLSRLFAKDLRSDQIFGCDPDAAILEWCKEIPGTFRQSEVKPRALPFDQQFDLIFAFSVFTHLGPRTHQSALHVVHSSLAGGGLLILTVRPRKFLEGRGAEFAHVDAEALEQALRNYDSGEFVYLPYNLPPVDDEVPYGEAVIPVAYVEKHWTDRFEIIENSIYESDPYQLPITLRRR
jgi:SAM-dependent methyltransferase